MYIYLTALSFAGVVNKQQHALAWTELSSALTRYYNALHQNFSFTHDIQMFNSIPILSIDDSNSIQRPTERIHFMEIAIDYQFARSELDLVFKLDEQCEFEF